MAKTTTLINNFGKMAGWNSITTNMLGRDIEGYLEVAYSDEKDKENAYGAGDMPIGRGDGNYSAKCSITLYLEEVIALRRSLGAGKRLVDIAPFDISTHYDYKNFIYKDRICNAEFRGDGVEVKQGDKTIAYKFDLIISHIDWNIV